MHFMFNEKTVECFWSCILEQQIKEFFLLLIFLAQTERIQAINRRKNVINYHPLEYARVKPCRFTTIASGEVFQASGDEIRNFLRYWNSSRVSFFLLLPLNFKVEVLHMELNWSLFFITQFFYYFFSANVSLTFVH